MCENVKDDSGIFLLAQRLTAGRSNSCCNLAATLGDVTPVIQEKAAYPGVDLVSDAAKRI